MHHLLDGQIGMLQGQPAEAHETVRVSGAQCGDLFVLARDDLCGEIAVGPVVVRGGEAHGLDIDSVLVHVAKARVHIFCGAEKRAIERGRAAVGNQGFRMALDQIVQVHVAVRVNVNRADAAASHMIWRRFPVARRLLSARKRACQAAIYEAEARGRARRDSLETFCGRACFLHQK